MRHVGQGGSVLTTGLDGFVTAEEHGFFVWETRLVSRYRWLVDGLPPLEVAVSNVAQHSSLGYYLVHHPEPERGGDGMPRATIAQQAVELRLSRSVGGGLHEDVDLTNFTRTARRLRLELEIDADFADLDEVDGERRQRGRIERRWHLAGALLFRYRAEHRYRHQRDRGIAQLERGLTVRVRNAASCPAYAGGRLAFDVELPAGGSWHACVELVAHAEGVTLAPVYGCRAFGPPATALDERREAFLTGATCFAVSGTAGLAPVAIGAIERAKHDLAALRLHHLDDGETAWTVAAGLPGYLALFGRDTLTTARESALLGDGIMRGTLAELARWQGTKTDDWRDEQPGRMLHQAHASPLAVLCFKPTARYYGSITTSAYYPVVVAELWHWTGDADLVRPFVDPALRALRWLDAYALRDGFYWYETRSEQGLRNQGWKDSGDAIVHADGRIAETPIATCEAQASVYVAKRHLSELLWWLGDHDQAYRLHEEANCLKARFNRTFWLEGDGFIAMGLDGRGQPIRSVGSDPGHCLAAGIVEDARAPAVADRLLADDLFTGWGIRTLSAAHPAYNPHSYHRGSVWPVEHGAFAIAFARYGLHDHLERIVRAQLEAASLFEFTRLPELFSGHARDQDHPFPAPYPWANSPQAWSAAAVVCMMQAILGLFPYAPLNALLLDPHLPPWLPEIALHGLRIGRATASIGFSRQSDGTTDYHLLAADGPLHVIRQPSPWSLTATYAERVRDLLASLLAGH